MDCVLLPIVRLSNGRTTCPSDELSRLLFILNNLRVLTRREAAQIHLQDTVGINHHDCFSLRQQTFYVLVDHPPGDEVEGKRVPERDHYGASVPVAPGAGVLGVRLAEFVDDRTREALRAGEADGATKGEDDDLPVAVGVVRILFARDDLRHRGTHAGPGDLAGVHHVETHVARQLLKQRHGAHAVAPVVQPGREGGDTDLPRQGADDPAGDTALGRDADPGDPVARGVVHAARGHDGEHLADTFRRHDGLARHGIHAGVAEGRRHHGQVTDVDVDGALADVALDDLGRPARDDAGRLEHVPDPHVAVGVLELGLVHLLVHVELPPGQSGHGLEDAVGPLLRRGVGVDHERVRRDGTGVDHGVHRSVVAPFQRQLVEGVAGRLHADLFQDALQPGVLDGDGVDKGFRDGLDGKLDLVVTGRVDIAVHHDDRHGQLGRVRVGQRLDVLSGHAIFDRPDLLQQNIQVVRDR